MTHDVHASDLGPVDQSPALVARSARRTAVRPCRHPARGTAALLAVLGLAAAGCGTGNTDEPDGATADSDDRGARTTTSVEGDSEGEPQAGGALVYGIEADTVSPWTPQNSLCASACHTIMKSVFDSLTVIAPSARSPPTSVGSTTPRSMPCSTRSAPSASTSAA